MQTANLRPACAASNWLGQRIGDRPGPSANPLSFARSQRPAAGDHSSSDSRRRGLRARRNHDDAVRPCPCDRRRTDVAPGRVQCPPRCSRTRLVCSSRAWRVVLWNASRSNTQWKRAAASAQLGSLCSTGRRSSGRASARSLLHAPAMPAPARAVHPSACACNALPLPA